MTLHVLSHGLHGATSNISNIRVKIYFTVFLSLVLSSQTWTCVRLLFVILLIDGLIFSSETDTDVT